MSTPVLLVDYGEVISDPQPAETIAAMAAIVELDVPSFLERYWQLRPAYDTGQTARAYWSALTRAELDDRVLDQLVRHDVDSWSHINEATLEVLAGAGRDGRSLALLSNAPHELAAMLRRHPAFAIFDHLFFSAELGLVKPHVAVFHATLRALSRPAGDVLFIDDRPANVEGARAAGLRAVRFTSPDQLRSELRRDGG